MDFLKEQASKYAGGSENNSNNQQSGNQGGNFGASDATNQNSSSNNNNNNNNNNSGSGGGFLGGISDKINGAAGGGRDSEKNEDYLDKGIDYVQEKFMGAGDQSNESAVEQAKDEQISDFIRGKYKSTTGNDFPIKDKPTTWDKSTD